MAQEYFGSNGGTLLPMETENVQVESRDLYLSPAATAAGPSRHHLFLPTSLFHPSPSAPQQEQSSLDAQRYAIHKRTVVPYFEKELRALSAFLLKPDAHVRLTIHDFRDKERKTVELNNELDELHPQAADHAALIEEYRQELRKLHQRLEHRMTGWLNSPNPPPTHPIYLRIIDQPRTKVLRVPSDRPLQPFTLSFTLEVASVFPFLHMDVEMQATAYRETRTGEFGGILEVPILSDASRKKFIRLRPRVTFCLEVDFGPLFTPANVAMETSSNRVAAPFDESTPLRILFHLPLQFGTLRPVLAAVSPAFYIIREPAPSDELLVSPLSTANEAATLPWPVVVDALRRRFVTASGARRPLSHTDFEFMRIQIGRIANGAEATSAQLRQLWDWFGPLCRTVADVVDLWDSGYIAPLAAAEAIEAVMRGRPIGTTLLRLSGDVRRAGALMMTYITRGGTTDHVKLLRDDQGAKHVREVLTEYSYFRQLMKFDYDAVSGVITALALVDKNAIGPMPRELFIAHWRRDRELDAAGVSTRGDTRMAARPPHTPLRMALEVDASLQRLVTAAPLIAGITDEHIRRLIDKRESDPHLCELVKDAEDAAVMETFLIIYLRQMAHPAPMQLAVGYTMPS